jgi:hypothetical protein
MNRDTGDGFLRLFFIFSSSFIQRIFISAQPNLFVFSVSIGYAQRIKFRHPTYNAPILLAQPSIAFCANRQSALNKKKKKSVK